MFTCLLYVPDESPAVTTFLTLLSQWDKPEIEEKMRQRVEFSKRAIGKLLQAYDRILQHNEKLWEAIKDKADEKQSKLEEDTSSQKESKSESCGEQGKRSTNEGSVAAWLLAFLLLLYIYKRIGVLWIEIIFLMFLKCKPSWKVASFNKIGKMLAIV